MRWLIVGALGACWSSPPAEPRHLTEGAFESAFPRVDSVAEVAAGNDVYAGCVVERDGRVECWGGPNVIHFIERRHGGPLPGPHVVAAAGKATAVRLGADRVGLCALGIDARVRCIRYVDAVDLGLANVTRLAVSRAHACAITADHAVWCWGDNLNGAVGVPPPESAPGRPAFETEIYRDATRVPGAGAADEVAVGYTGACAVGNGKLVCWGVNPFTMHAATTRAELLDMVRPTVVAQFANVKHASFDYKLGCVATRDDRIACVVNDGRLRKVELSYDTNLDVPIQLDVRGEHACVLHAGGAVSCWKVGGPHTLHRIADLDDAVEIAVAADHVCVATRGGHARCFGKNDLGQLGDGTLANRASPSFVVQFQPELVPAPVVGPYGCTTDTAQRTACAARGDDCSLQPPPGSWILPTHSGGRLCDTKCIADAQHELDKFPVPRCGCECESDPVPPGSGGPPPPPIP